MPGSIRPVTFGSAGTDPAEISIPAVKYIINKTRIYSLDMSRPGLSSPSQGEKLPRNPAVLT